MNARKYLLRNEGTTRMEISRETSKLALALLGLGIVRTVLPSQNGSFLRFPHAAKREEGGTGPLSSGRGHRPRGKLREDGVGTISSREALHLKGK